MLRMSHSSATVGLLLLVVVISGFGSGPGWMGYAHGAPLPVERYDVWFPAGESERAQRRKETILALACRSDRELFDQLSSLEKDDNSHEAAINILMAKAYLYLERKWVNGEAAIDDAEACLGYAIPDILGIPEHELSDPQSRWLHVRRDAGCLEPGRYSYACLKLEINDLIPRIKRPQSMGTHGLPCSSMLTFIGGMSKGEWNVGLRPLMRMLAMAHNAEKNHGILLLDERSWQKLWDDLLPLDGPPPESHHYPATECANQESSSGSPQDRIDDDSYYSSLPEKIGNGLLDLLKWFWRHVIRPALAAGAADALVPGSGPIILGLAATGAAAEDLARTVLIPETENHILQIEVARYLTNQLILERVGIDGNHGHYPDHQRRLRNWLLGYLGNIARRDFIEYNSRPYQRYSIPALQNLHDFANYPPSRGEVLSDDELRAAAKAVLELASAKFALGSLQSRRYVPFRRKMEVVVGQRRDGGGFHAAVIEFPGNQGSGTTGLFDLGESMDYQIAAFTLYNGPSRQSPRPGHVTFDTLRNALPAAVSSYEPSPLVTAIASSECVQYEQTFNHQTQERFVRGPGFLLSAGGRMAEHAYKARWAPGIQLPGMPLPGLAPSIDIMGQDDDLGLALPSTLMLSVPLADSTLESLVHFKGLPEWFPGLPVAPKDRMLSYDHNLCVAGRFACGYNLTIPADYPVHEVRASAGRWLFVSSGELDEGTAASEAVYVALFQADSIGGAATHPGVGNAGLMEISTADRFSNEQDGFAAFRREVIRRNGQQPQAWIGTSISNVPGFRGVYTTIDGTTIEFDMILRESSGQLAMANGTGLVSINGVGQPSAPQWPRARGLLNAEGPGRYRLDGQGSWGACPVPDAGPRLCYTDLLIHFDEENSPRVQGGHECAH